MSDTGNDADLLYGVPAIAAFMGMQEKPCRHRIEAGFIPTFKFGDTICARESKILAKLAEMEIAPPPPKGRGRKKAGEREPQS